MGEPLASHQVAVLERTKKGVKGGVELISKANLFGIQDEGTERACMRVVVLALRGLCVDGEESRVGLALLQGAVADGPAGSGVDLRRAA